MPDRRSGPRPPLWLNLLLLALALATFAFATVQRKSIRHKTSLLFHQGAASPDDLNRMRDDLAQMDLTKQQLAKELDGRLEYLQMLQSEQFYISIDTARKKFQLRLGKEVVREADVQIGDPKTLTANGKTWMFYPLKGAFSVTGKDDDFSSPVAEWVYPLNGQPVPATRPTVRNWLGRHVIFLPNGYVIQSPPAESSPLKGPKPGSFMVPDADLAAIWPRITTDTRVYIF